MIPFVGSISCLKLYRWITNGSKFADYVTTGCKTEVNLQGSFDFHKTDNEADFVIVDNSKHPAYLEKGRYCHDEAILAFRQVSKFWQVQVNPKCVRSTTKLGMLIEYVRG